MLRYCSFRLGGGGNPPYQDPGKVFLSKHSGIHVMFFEWYASSKNSKIRPLLVVSRALRSPRHHGKDRSPRFGRGQIVAGLSFCCRRF